MRNVNGTVRTYVGKNRPSRPKAKPTNKRRAEVNTAPFPAVPATTHHEFVAST